MRKVLVVCVLGSALIVRMTGLAFAAAGDLDTSFDGNGKLATNFTSGDDPAMGVAVEPGTNKVVVVGRADVSGGRFAVARYNDDGSPDTSFSSDGKLTTDITTGDDYATDVAITNAGIVVVGRAGGSGGRFAVVRYNDDGTLDSSFDDNGILATNFTTGDDIAFGVAIRNSDGGIVVAGGTGGSDTRFAVAVYNESDGSPDTSFSGNGLLTTDFTTEADFARGVALDSSENIVAAGRAGGAGGRFAAARYDSAGALDSTFSGDGRMVTDITTGNDLAFGIDVDGSDKVVAAGRAAGSGGRFALVRYNEDGTLDTSFDGNGILATNFTSGDDAAFGVAVDVVGNIVAAGRAGGSNEKFALARYLESDGSLDTDFSGNGLLTTDFTSGDDFANALDVDGGGNIVAAGRASGFGGRFAVARYVSAYF